MPQIVTDCLLCGATPLTKEHIWPRWLQRLFNREILPHVRGGEGDRVVAKGWQAPPFTAERLLLCALCNNKRLGALEGAAKPLLAPMILGHPQALTPEAQGTMTRWGFKTVLMLHAAEYNPPDPLPRAHLDALWQQPSMPDSVWAWIGMQDITDAGYWIKPLLAARGGATGPAGTPNGYWATLSIGALLIQILGMVEQIPEYLQEEVEVTAALGMQRIWPAQSGTVHWPSDLVVTFEATKKLREAFAGQEELTWDSTDLDAEGNPKT